jgi:hypothetical protein
MIFKSKFNVKLQKKFGGGYQHPTNTLWSYQIF